MGVWFFDDWAGIGRTLVVGVLAYVALVAFLRISGKRTLAKLNAFDFVVTVALGSTLATIILSGDISLAEGATALGLLVALQYAVTWTSVRVRWVRRAVTGEPRLLVSDGHLVRKAMVAARVTEEEVSSAVRSAGLGDVQRARAVIFETDGSFSVIPSDGRAPDVGTGLPVNS